MNLLSRWKIRTKLASMVALSALAVCAIIALTASLSEKRMLEDRVNQLRTAVDLMVGMAETLQDEVTAGKMTLAEAQAQFRLRGRKMIFGNGQAYAVVYNADTSLLLNAALPQLEGKITGATDSNGIVIADAQIAAARQSPEGGTGSYLYPRPGQTVPVRKMVFARHFAPWNVVISYGLYVDDVDADVHALLLRLGAVDAVVMTLMALLSWLIARDILGALDRQRIRMQRIATGSLDQAVEETERGDEIGRMAETLELLRQTAMTARTLEAEQIATKEQAESEKREALIALADRFDTSVGRLVGMMASGSTELEATAQSMTGTAERTNHRASVVSSAAAEASTRVQTVAAAAEELTSSIGEISRQVAQSANITIRAVDNARLTDTIVRALADGAHQIEHVAELISSIAGQTNLLALNATIEAARAGEAGRGFAVVASEVKSLANQTAKATDEIRSQIANMQNVTTSAVGAIRNIGHTIGEINEVATVIAAAVEEQGAATREIARNIQHAAGGTAEVSSNIVGVSTASTEAGSAAGEVLSASSALRREAEILRSEIDAFLSNIRAA
jgi:methyl-accepting chemotaxis protein